MSPAEFSAALKRHGFRVVCAKIEDATGKCPGVRRLGAVLRKNTFDIYTAISPSERWGCGCRDGRATAGRDEVVGGGDDKPAGRMSVNATPVSGVELPLVVAARVCCTA
jgi:hypothetical protein